MRDDRGERLNRMNERVIDDLLRDNDELRRDNQVKDDVIAMMKETDRCRECGCPAHPPARGPQE